jgi:mTERF
MWNALRFAMGLLFLLQTQIQLQGFSLPVTKGNKQTFLFTYQHCSNVRTATCLHASNSSRTEKEASRKQALKLRLGMTEKEIMKVLGSFNLLKYREENLESALDFLQQCLKADQKELKKIVLSCPTLLGYQPATLESKIEWYQQKFGWSDKDLVNMVSASSFLSLSIEESVVPKLRWFQTTFNLTDAQLSKVIKGESRLLGTSMECLEDTHSWLVGTLELYSTAAKQKLFLRAPGIFTLKAKNMQPKISWLQDQFNLTGSEVAKVLWKCPSILKRSLEECLKPNSRWLDNRLGYSALRKVVKMLPSILNLNMENNIEPRLKYLKDQLNLDDEGLVQLVGGMPTLLAMRRENIETTIQFFADCFGKDHSRDQIVSSPTYLTRSLQYRLIPRWQEAVKCGFEEQVLLYQIAMYTNETWDEFVAAKSVYKML